MISIEIIIIVSHLELKHAHGTLKILIIILQIILTTIKK